MSEPGAIRICVAVGTGPGGVWSLWYPAWRWATLPAEEQRRIIEEQASRFHAANVEILDKERAYGKQIRPGI